MEQKNTENCTNICKLTNCRLSTLILTNEKQDEIFILIVKPSRNTGDVHCTGMAQVKGLHIRLSLEKKSTHKKAPSFFIFIVSDILLRLARLRLTLTFYFQHHTGLNVPSHKEKKKKKIRRPKIVWLVCKNKQEEIKNVTVKRRQKHNDNTDRK